MGKLAALDSRSRIRRLHFGEFHQIVFDHRIEKLRREAQARSLAVSLRAEVCTLSSVLWSRYANIYNAILVHMAVAQTYEGDDAKTFRVKQKFPQCSYTIYESQAHDLNAGSYMTPRWRRQSRANPSLKPNSLLAGKIQGILFV